MRILLTTGGTGGHIFPALAVAEQLQKKGAELLFVGSQYGPEAELLKKAGIPFEGLHVRGVLGRGLASISAIAGLLAAVVPARRILKRFQPHVVAAFGAYASVAPVLAARMRGIPITVHEQNTIPGLANRLAGKLAKRIFLSLPSTYFPQDRCFLTGNPVREAIRHIPDRANCEKHLLVMGGSQGAVAINSIVLAALPRLVAAGVQIRHQCGAYDLERVKAGYTAHGFDTSGISPFIDDMAEAYAWADLLLCRAGATSVAEITVAGKPAIFIPFPYAIHDHQTLNARVLVKAGAACLVQEKNASIQDAGAIIINLLENANCLKAMTAASKKLAKPDAAEHVAEGILEIAG